MKISANITGRNELGIVSDVKITYDDDDKHKINIDGTSYDIHDVKKIIDLLTNPLATAR